MKAKLYLTACRIERLSCRKSIYATISVVDCTLGIASITDSDINVTFRRSILTGLKIQRCVGRLTAMHCMTSYRDALQLNDNEFMDLDLQGTPLMGQITLPMWNVSYCADMMRIGCQQHSLEAWRNFTAGEIESMDMCALAWWREWRDTIFAVVDKAAPKIRGLASQVKDLEAITNELRENVRNEAWDRR